MGKNEKDYTNNKKMYLPQIYFISPSPSGVDLGCIYLIALF